MPFPSFIACFQPDFAHFASVQCLLSALSPIAAHAASIRGVVTDASGARDHWRTVICFPMGKSWISGFGRRRQLSDH